MEVGGRASRTIAQVWCGVLVLVLTSTTDLSAHGVSAADKAFMEQGGLMAFLYLGAKHMVTGYDHLLFLFGVIFFLYRLRDVGLYVTLFAVGHSVTLLYGVLSGTNANPFIVDAIIGFSVVYKAFENVGGLNKLGIAINTKLAVLGFGLFHGLGLATKVRDLGLSDDGLLVNLISFNVGVEIGQVMVLTVVVFLLNLWRPSRTFAPGSFYANLALMAAGFALIAYQLTGYFAS